MKISRRQRARLATGLLVVAALVTLPAVWAALSPEPSGSDREVVDITPAGPIAEAEAEAEAEAPGESTPPTRPSAENRLQERITQTLGLDAFPDLSPPVDDLGIARWYDDMVDYGCLSVLPEDVDSCTFGPADSDRVVAVVGDSYAIAYMPAIREGLGEGFRVHQLTLQECPVWDAPTNRSDGSAYPECGDYRGFVAEQVAEIQPDVLVLATSWQAGRLLSSGATGPAAAEELVAGYRRSLAELVPSARLTVVLGSPPGSTDLQECVTKVGSPDDCVAPPSEVFEAVVEGEEAVAEESGAVFVDTRPWFCSDGRCPGFVGRTPVYADGGHLTIEYSTELGPVMLAALKAAVAELEQRPGGAG